MRIHSTGAVAAGAIVLTSLLVAGASLTTNPASPVKSSGAMRVTNPAARGATGARQVAPGHASSATVAFVGAAAARPTRSAIAPSLARRGAAPRAARAGAVEPARNETPSAGMVVAVDPETGQLGMPERTAFEALSVEQLQSLARLEAAGLVTVRHADGSESLEHDGRFTDYTTLHVVGDGKNRFQCVHGKHGVERSMQSKAPVPHDAEEE